MRNLLYLMTVLTLLATAGCIFPGDRGYREERGGRIDVHVGEGGGHFEHEDHDRGHDDRH